MVNSILPLVLNDACVHKKGLQIVGPLNMQLQGRGCSIVMGPNGSGKTTFLRLMHGLEMASQGQVIWNGNRRDVYPRQSFVFQTPVVMRRSVRENIAYPLITRGHKKRTALLEADRWIDEVGLHGSAQKDALVLSGGEKQKLALARALITKPEVLFLDEPSSNLDGASTYDIETLIFKARDSGTRIVMATHDFGQARRLASEIYFMYHGTIHEHAVKDDFFAGPKTKEARAFIKGDILI